MIRIAAELTRYEKAMKEAIAEFQHKVNKYKMTGYDVIILMNDIEKRAGEKLDPTTRKKMESFLREEALPGYGITVTKGMHASQDLFFASEDDAFQYLSDVTGMKVMVAKKWSGKIKPKWSPSEGLFTKGAETIANELAKASKTLKQAMGRLNFYVNRAGENLSDKDRGRLEHAKELIRKKFES